MGKGIVPIIERQQVDTKQLEASIAFRWAEYQQADRQRTAMGLDLGKACYELREGTKAQGSRTGTGFMAALDKLNIPRSTAYKWIGRYEVSAGLCPRVDNVWQSILPQLSGDRAIVGVCGDITVRIEPSSSAGFYFVTCIETAKCIADGMSKPIRQDAVGLAITTAIAESTGGDSSNYPGESFAWGIEPAEASNSNRWLAGGAA